MLVDVLTSTGAQAATALNGAGVCSVPLQLHRSELTLFDTSFQEGVLHDIGVFFGLNMLDTP